MAEVIRLSDSPIEKARLFVKSQVIDPALENKHLSETVKRKVKHSEFWLNQFERVGDLLIYLTCSPLAIPI